MANSSEDILGSIGLMTIVCVVVYYGSKLLLGTSKKEKTPEEKKIDKLKEEVWLLKDKLNDSIKEKEEIRQFYSELPMRKALKELDEWKKRNKDK